MRHRKQILAGGMAAVLLCALALTDIGAASIETEDTPGKPAVLAAVSAPVFSDVPSGAWYEDAVNWCRENDIMGGAGNNTFLPDIIFEKKDRKIRRGVVQ